MQDPIAGRTAPAGPHIPARLVFRDIDADRVPIERGGPLVAAPARKGFGSRLIAGALAAALPGTVRQEFAPEGLTCHIAAPLGTFPAAFATAGTDAPLG
jgi:hypothetical protein